MNLLNSRIVLVVLSVLLFSCNRAKDKGQELLEQSKEFLKEEIKQLATEDLRFRKTTFIEEFGEPSYFEITNLNGIWCEMPYGFYYGFLKYETNGDSVMKYISEIETRLPNISDTVFFRTDTLELYSSITNVKQEYDKKLIGAFDFFEEIKGLETSELYKCSRYPNIHILIIDKKTNIIYHHFQKYWD